MTLCSEHSTGKWLSSSETFNCTLKTQSVRLVGSFNSFSLSSKTRTPLAVPYNRLTRSASWFLVWQLGREQLCEEASPWCQSTSLSNFRWQSHYYTLSASARKMDRNSKSQGASATWEQESSLQHPAEVSAFWSCASALTQTPAFPVRLVLRIWLIVTSEGPHKATHSFYGAYIIAPYQQPPYGKKKSTSSFAEMWRGALHKQLHSLLHCRVSLQTAVKMLYQATCLINFHYKSHLHYCWVVAFFWPYLSKESGKRNTYLNTTARISPAAEALWFWKGFVKYRWPATAF